MGSFNNRRFARPSVLLALIPALVSCSDFAGTVREVTYPPGFTYVSREKLDSRMQELGYELQQLELALAPERSGESEQQQQVVDILRNMAQIAGSIQAGDAGSNHPFLQNDMTAFRTTVGQARTAAAANPPRYYAAGRVAGGCTNCHRINRR